MEHSAAMTAPRLLLALVLCAGVPILWPAPAAADPIFTPIFTSLLIGGLGVTASTAGVIAPILTGIVTTAIGIGLSLLFTPKPPKPDNGQFAIQQSTPPRAFGYGRARTAGYIMFLEEYAESLYHVAALVGHRITGVVATYLNDDQVTIGEDGFVEEGEDGRYGDETIRIDTRLGLDTETAYADVVAEVPEWTTNHRGDGIASGMMIARDVGPINFAKRYPYQRPQASWVIDLAPVFDPREGGQDWDDPDTWEWSDNPALAILHFECFSPFGPRRDYQTAILPVLDRWIDEADICDEAMPLKAGGTEKRYRLGGISTTEHDPRTVRSALLQCCDGWMVERGDGTLILVVGKYRTPTVTITDDDIAGWYWQDGLANEDRAELIAATYTSPDNGYVTVDTDPVALDNGEFAVDQQRKSMLELPWVQSTGQASRLLRREVSRYGETVRGQLFLRLSAINALYERWVKIESSIPRLQNQVIENRRPTLSLLDGRCTMEFVRSGSQVDTYDAASMESTAPTVPTRPATVGPPIPANVAVVAEQTRGTDDKATIRLVVSWDAPVINGDEKDTFRWVVRWRKNGSGASGWTEQSYQRLTISAGRITARTGSVPTSQDLDVQVASAMSRGTLSQWSATETITTTIDGLAPGAPTNFTATGGSTVALECKAPNSYIFKAVQFFRGSTSDDFEDAVPIGQKVKGNPKQTLDYEDNPAAGTYRYWVVAISEDGVSSTPTGPETATAT
jgi:hypothetical protein